MMARQFESGFYLVERCRRELPGLAACFGTGSAMRSALEDLVKAAEKVDGLLSHAHEPGELQRRASR